jgi:hypothetical protein
MKLERPTFVRIADIHVLVTLAGDFACQIVDAGSTFTMGKPPFCTICMGSRVKSKSENSVLPGRYGDRPNAFPVGTMRTPRSWGAELVEISEVKVAHSGTL